MFILIFAWLTAAGVPQSTVAFFTEESACEAAAAAHIAEIGNDPVLSNGLWACLAAPLTLPAAQPKGST